MQGGRKDGARWISALVKTVECGSFTEAARALSYSQSGISRMIGDLEREWNVALLERGRGGVRLTSEGCKLLPGVQAVCDEYHRLQMQVDELNGLQAGLIRIGVFSSVATHWLPNIIRKFQRGYPNIDYELLVGEYAEIEEWIAEGRIDCGFVKMPARPELETTFLERDELLAVVPEGHPLATLDRIPLKALCAAPFMLLERGAKAEVSEIFERNRLVPNVHFTTWDDYAIMSMVESGLGVSILPRLILKRIPYRIVAKPLDVPAFRDIGLARRGGRTPLAVERFLEYLSYR